MTDEPLCTMLSNELGGLFSCSPHRDYVRIRTPFWYPDGGVIDVYATKRDGRFIVTDLGESLGWLKQQSVSAKRTDKQNRLLQDVCLTLGVELFKGQLVMKSAAPKEFAHSVIKLGQAAVRVSDLWFTTRTRSVESVTDEVADYLQEQSIAADRAVKVPGRSGRSWSVDFQTHTPEQSAFVFVLTTGSRAGARRVTEHVVAGWHDLVPLRTSAQRTRFVSLFDDTQDVWAEDDFKLAESLSDIARWSRPDEFSAMLREAA
ncbi:MAG: DUF1828 domain-containing protein [Spartobacteria bacterium]|nr:DUF1828 domain-containing protein [Spartobacteria bacterium]